MADRLVHPVHEPLCRMPAATAAARKTDSDPPR